MKSFYVITNNEKDRDYKFTESICDYLRSKNCVCDYQTVNADTELNSLNYARLEDIPQGTECVIVLGGDGTLIQAARELSQAKIPVFGINIGHIGYLTEIDMENAFQAFDVLIKGEYYIDKRMMLEACVLRNDSIIHKHTALNDIVINRNGSLHIIDFDIYVNDEFLVSYPADGVIIATPTGSTAYNLSAGGPIIRPETQIIVMTPICPHTLNKSSVILDEDDVIEIRFGKSRSHTEERAVSFDGDSYYNLIEGDRVIVRKSRLYAHFIRTGRHNFLQILRSKLS